MLELLRDFAHSPQMQPLSTMRRAGLWCALHGESMLEAGINHLECTYDLTVLLDARHVDGTSARYASVAMNTGRSTL